METWQVGGETWQVAVGNMAGGWGNMAGVCGRHRRWLWETWQVGVGHGRKFCGGMASGCGACGRWLYRGSVSQYVFSNECCHHYHCSFCVCLQVAFEIIGVISVLTNCALIGMDPEVQKLLPSDVTAVNMVIIFVAVEV